MESQEYKTPIGYPDWVVVSKNGDVFLKDRTANRGANVIKLKAKFASQKDDGHGYRVVQFRIGGVNKNHKVHRLVLSAFTGVSGEGMDANHKNGKRDDNRIENLEWCSRSENLAHSYRVLGRVAAWKGRPAHNSGNINSSPYCKPIVGTSLKTGEKIMFCSAADAGRNGFSRDGIAHCLTGRQKTSKGYSWEFKNS